MRAIAEVVTAEMDHIPFIAARVRPADREEIWALYRQTPQECLVDSFRISHLAWTGLINGEPVCMFGAVQADRTGRVGRPWMIGTELLDEHQTVFLRRCSEQVETMQMCFASLENVVDARNLRAIKWLRWLGFSFSEPEPMGPDQILCHRFTRGAF